MARVYAFIDSQNLNLGVRAHGWQLDFRKFRQYLRDKHDVGKAYLFIGYQPGNEALYTALQSYGYILVFKPTMQLPDGTVKGNVDAELVLHAMIEFPVYDQAIIVSGDGDFYCLAEYLDTKGKLLRILAPSRRYSTLLRKYATRVVQVGRLRGSLEYKQKK
ncbi:MAG TPA: NYN domain-containing protein [Candidatus Saccharimonadia bacterium]|nr:NYN domain-containing protein [Candidatus Saccharimonadia bacterium]